MPDLSIFRYAPPGRSNHLKLSLKVVDVSEVTPGCDNKAAHTCKKKCVEDQIASEITCRLPYISKSVQLPLCNVTKEAKKVSIIYKERMLLAVCQCPKPCQTEIYETEMIGSPFLNDKLPVVIILFYFTSSSLKTIRTRFSFFFIKYLCEIGSILGLFLGMSVLNLCDLFLSFLKASHKSKREKVPKGELSLSARVRRLAVNYNKYMP